MIVLSGLGFSTVVYLNSWSLLIFEVLKEDNLCLTSL